LAGRPAISHNCRQEPLSPSQDDSSTGRSRAHAA